MEVGGQTGKICNMVNVFSSLTPYKYHEDHIVLFIIKDEIIKKLTNVKCKTTSQLDEGSYLVICESTFGETGKDQRQMNNWTRKEKEKQAVGDIGKNCTGSLD